MKLVNIALIKGIIKELDIEDKIKINDDYIKFLLDNPCDKIRKLRKKKKMTLQQFGELLGVIDTSVRRWEHGHHQISRKKIRETERFYLICKSLFYFIYNT
jgi:DNA-binding transcriptional regulator YiaG